jgi:hypothetical protein
VAVQGTTNSKATILVIALLISALLGCSLARAEVSQKQGVRVTVAGAIAPKRLPRKGEAPIAVTVSGRIDSTKPGASPQLKKFTIQINRAGRLSFAGIPSCRIGRIDPSTTQQAMAACGPSLIGEGHFSTDVRLPEQSPFPSDGKVLAFAGKVRGEHAIFAHIYGTQPVDTSYVLPFLVKSTPGTFGTTLEAFLPQATGEWGFVSGISLSLNRKGFISAGCPAPAGFSKASFPMMRTSFGFAGGLQMSETLNRTCKAIG